MDKRFVVLTLLATVLSGSTWAVGFMGPPTAELDKGQISVGFSYTYMDTDLDDTSVVEVDYVDGALDAVDPPGAMQIRDAKVQRYYGVLSYGIRDWCEAYVQLGAADVKFDRFYVDEPQWIGFNFDNDFAWGWGSRFTLRDLGKIRWGVAVQMNWLDTSWDGMFRDDVTSQQIDLDTYDLLVAVGPTIDMDRWTLYGGLFYYYLSGDYEITENGTVGEGVWTDIGKADVDAESLGGFIGAQFTVAQKAKVMAEFSATEDGWASGIGLGWDL